LIGRIFFTVFGIFITQGTEKIVRG